MKISDPMGTGIGGLGDAQPVSPGSQTGGSRTGNKAGGDQVQLSNLSGMLSAGPADSAARSHRLAQLAASVAAGTYQVDSHTLSSSIIRSSMRA